MWSMGGASVCWLLAFVFLVCPAGLRGESYIVRDGVGKAEIVVAEDPSRVVPIAAGELQSIIERMTGARLPIVTTPSGGGVLKIFVGRSRYTDELGLSVADLDHDAYRIVSGDSWLALLGRDDDFQLPEPYARDSSDIPRMLAEFKDLTGLHVSRLPTSRVAWRYYNPELDIYEQDGRGSANAVYGFLYDLGFRWYFPGELGQVVPQHATIELPRVDRTVRPDFALRRFEQYYHRFGQEQAVPGEVKWQLSLGTNMGYEYRGIGTFGHGLSSITTGRYAYRGEDLDAFHAGHPEEFYALYDGERDIGSNQCLSSEGLFEAAVAYARALYDIYDVKIVDISPDDGFSRLCQCELCAGKARDEMGRSGRLSDHVFGFVNRVAEELYKSHPDRFVSASAYSAFLLPPESIEALSPNVVIKLCKWRTWQSQSADDGSRYTAEEVRDLRQAWLDILPSGKLIRSDYYLHARSRPHIPAYFPRQIAADLKALQGISEGEDSEVFRNFHGWERGWHALATNHLNLYVTARYYWDADQDLDALLEEYYDLFYGPAAAQMKAFVEYSEANWRLMIADPAVITQALGLLESAAAAVDPDSIYGRRIRIVADYVQPLYELSEQMQRPRRDDRSYRALRLGVGGRERMSGKPLDGVLDERFWPPGSRRFTLLNSSTGERGAYETRTEFQIFRDGSVLYVGIRCWEPDMDNLAIGASRDNDARILDGDLVTLLIETQSNSYYEITFNPAGALFEVDHSGDEPLVEWSSGARVAIHRDKYFWSAELRLPIAGQGARLLDPLEGIDGDQPTNLFPWYFNIGRQRVRDGVVELSAFSPTGADDLHVPEQFGRLWGR